jgi:chitinase
VLGDFTGDGNLDVAQANPDSVTIRRGQGNGAFAPAETFAANSGPFGLAAADFNGDGWLDVATVTAHGGSVLVNDRLWPFVPPIVSVSDTPVMEGNTGTTSATFTLTLSHASPVDVTVHYATADLTAAAGSDYTAASGDVTIPAGQTSVTVNVAVRGDRLGESTETFAVNLSAPTNAMIGDGQGIVSILDNEPLITITDKRMAEGRKGRTTLFTFTVTLSAAYDQPVTVSFRTVNGTATTSDNDYVAKTGTLTFAPGETTKTITIEVKGDKKREANESFYVELFGNSGNSWLGRSLGYGTILNDD